MKTGNPTSTFELISKIRSGDQVSFSRLFSRYQNKISLLISYKLGTNLHRQISVQDLLQETFLRAYRDFDQFEYRKPGSFMHWLSTIADHVIADQARKINRKKRKASDYLRFKTETNPQGPEPATSLSPSRIYDNRQQLEKLRRTLDSLPENYRKIIILAKIEGLTTSEIAERLQKSHQNTSLLLHRALKRFREIHHRRSQLVSPPSKK